MSGTLNTLSLDQQVKIVTSLNSEARTFDTYEHASKCLTKELGFTVTKSNIVSIFKRVKDLKSSISARSPGSRVTAGINAQIRELEERLTAIESVIETLIETGSKAGD